MNSIKRSKLFNLAIKINPKNDNYHIKKGILLNELKKYEKSDRSFLFNQLK